MYYYITYYIIILHIIYHSLSLFLIVYYYSSLFFTLSIILYHYSSLCTITHHYSSHCLALSITIVPVSTLQRQAAPQSRSTLTAIHTAFLYDGLGLVGVGINDLKTKVMVGLEGGRQLHLALTNMNQPT